MSPLDRIKQQLHLADTADKLKTVALQAIEYAEFVAAQHAFAEGRYQRAKKQVEVQTQMITNLENALHGKKK